MVKGWVDDVSHLMLSFVAIGAVSEVIFGGYDRKYMEEDNFAFTKVIDTRQWAIQLE